MATDSTTTHVPPEGGQGPDIPGWLRDAQDSEDRVTTATSPNTTNSSPESGKFWRRVRIGLGVVAVSGVVYLAAQAGVNIFSSISDQQAAIAQQKAEDKAEALLQSQILEASKKVVGLDDPSIVGEIITVQQGGGFIDQANEIVQSQPGYEENDGQIDRIINESGKAINSLGTLQAGDLVAVVGGDANNDGKRDYVFNEVNSQIVQPSNSDGTLESPQTN